MHLQDTRSISGSVYRRENKSGPVWYFRARLPHEVRKKLGPAWTKRGRPPTGYLTKTTAETALDAILADARRGQLTGYRATGVVFDEAIAEFLRRSEHDRQCKRSTLDDYRSAGRAHLLPAFGGWKLEQVTTVEIEAWVEAWVAAKTHAPRTINKILTIMSGVMERARKVYGLPANPVEGVERLKEKYTDEIEVYSHEEIMALVRAAQTKRDGAIFLTAAFTGLRMGELLALRWRDVDFEGSAVRVARNYTHGELGTTKSVLMRSVPMVAEVARVLAGIGEHDAVPAPDGLVFPSPTSKSGFLDASALRRRYKAARKDAGLRELRFHDLRHTFGTLAIRKASILQVQGWMGHADIKTTMVYLHHRDQDTDAKLLAEAFQGEPIPETDTESLAA